MSMSFCSLIVTSPGRMGGIIWGKEVTGGSCLSLSVSFCRCPNRIRSCVLRYNHSYCLSAFHSFCKVKVQSEG